MGLIVIPNPNPATNVDLRSVQPRSPEDLSLHGAAFSGASTASAGGYLLTQDDVAGITDLTLGFTFNAANVWPSRNTLAQAWVATGANCAFQIRQYVASGTPTSGSWSDGIIVWLRSDTPLFDLRFASIPLTGIVPSDTIQLVIRFRLGLESSPGVPAPDVQKVEAWYALNNASGLTKPTVTHGSGFGASTAHPTGFVATAPVVTIGGALTSQYGGAYDWNGDILDAWMIKEALSDADIARTRLDTAPADMGWLCERGGSWWRLSASNSSELANVGFGSNAVAGEGTDGGIPVIT